MVLLLRQCDEQGLVLCLVLRNVIPSHENVRVTMMLFCLQDEGSFQMKQAARARLKQLGSEVADEIAWRDMWVFVAIKAGK